MPTAVANCTTEISSRPSAFSPHPLMHSKRSDATYYPSTTTRGDTALSQNFASATNFGQSTLVFLEQRVQCPNPASILLTGQGNVSCNLKACYLPQNHQDRTILSQCLNQARYNPKIWLCLPFGTGDPKEVTSAIPV